MHYRLGESRGRRRYILLAVRFGIHAKAIKRYVVFPSDIENVCVLSVGAAPSVRFMARGLANNVADDLLRDDRILVSQDRNVPSTSRGGYRIGDAHFVVARIMPKRS